MKIIFIKFLLTFFFLLIFIKVGLSDEKANLEKTISLLEKELYQINQKLVNTDKKLFQIKRLFVYYFIKEKFFEKTLLIQQFEQDYLQNLKNFYILKSYLNWLLTQYKKEKTNLMNLKISYEKKLNESLKLKQEYIKTIANNNLNEKNFPQKLVKSDNMILDPLSGRPIKEGSYRRKINPGEMVKTPISGYVKNIKVKEGTISIKIENDKCMALLSGFSTIKVTPGEFVRALNTIGEVGYSEGEYNFYYEIWCKK